MSESLLGRLLDVQAAHMAAADSVVRRRDAAPEDLDEHMPKRQKLEADSTFIGVNDADEDPGMDSGAMHKVSCCLIYVIGEPLHFCSASIGWVPIERGRVLACSLSCGTRLIVSSFTVMKSVTDPGPSKTS